MSIKLSFCGGMKLHGENACKFHGFKKYNPKTDKNKPAMFWLYIQDDYNLLASHKGKKYIFWHNADVVALSRQFFQNIITLRNPEIIHICHNWLLRDELASMGIYAIIRPIFWGDVSKLKPFSGGFLNENQRTKDCYMTANAGRGPEYGEYLMNSLAWKFPDWKFHVFGIEPTIPIYCDNVKYYGWIPEDKMDKIDQNFMICLRLNQHDGFSQTVMKARMRGQAAITTIRYNETNHYRTFDELCDYFISMDSLNESDHFALNFDRVKTEHFTNFDFIKE